MYNIIINEDAEKQISRLPEKLASRIADKILLLEDNPRPSGVKKLIGTSCWRIRVGDYQVIYSIDDKNLEIEIGAVKYRQSAYE